MYTVAPRSKITAHFVVIRIFLRYKFPSLNLYGEYTVVHVYEEKYSCKTQSKTFKLYMYTVL